MQRYTVIIFFSWVLVFFSSCKKDQCTKDGANYSSIVGAWELRQVQAGMIPAIDYSPGNGSILKFSNSMYEKYTNNSLVASGQYILIEDTSVEAEVGLVIPSGQFTRRIIYDNDFSSRKTFIQASDNKLTFLSGYFPLDGGSNVLYQRIGNNR